MPEAHKLYESFVRRDLLAYGVPGCILFGALHSLLPSSALTLVYEGTSLPPLIALWLIGALACGLVNASIAFLLYHIVEGALYQVRRLFRRPPDSPRVAPLEMSFATLIAPTLLVRALNHQTGLHTEPSIQQLRRLSDYFLASANLSFALINAYGVGIIAFSFSGELTHPIHVVQLVMRSHLIRNVMALFALVLFYSSIRCQREILDIALGHRDAQMRSAGATPVSPPPVPPTKHPGTPDDGGQAIGGSGTR